MSKNTSSASTTTKVTETPKQEPIKTEEVKPTPAKTESTKTDTKSTEKNPLAFLKGAKLKANLTAPKEQISEQQDALRELLETYQVEGVSVGITAPVKIYSKKSKLENVRWDYYLQMGFGQCYIALGDYQYSGNVGTVDGFLTADDREGTTCLLLMVDQELSDLRSHLLNMRDSTLPANRRLFKSLPEIFVEYSAVEFEGNTLAAKTENAEKMIRGVTETISEFGGLPEEIRSLIHSIIPVRFAMRLIELCIQRRQSLAYYERAHVDQLISAQGLTDLDFNLDVTSRESFQSMNDFAYQNAQSVLDSKKIDKILAILKGIKEIMNRTNFFDISAYQRMKSAEKHRVFLSEIDPDTKEEDQDTARKRKINRTGLEQGTGVKMPMPEKKV